MVAISMYRGNLHKVPDVPRRWSMPDRNLSVKDFKSLLHRRKRALSRIALNSNLTVKTELVTDQEDAIQSEPSSSSGKQKLVEVKREANRVSGDENGRCDGFDGAPAQGSDGGDLLGREADNNVPHGPHVYAANQMVEVSLNMH